MIGLCSEVGEVGNHSKVYNNNISEDGGKDERGKEGKDERGKEGKDET